MRSVPVGKAGVSLVKFEVRVVDKKARRSRRARSCEQYPLSVKRIAPSRNAQDHISVYNGGIRSAFVSRTSSRSRTLFVRTIKDTAVLLT